MATADHKAEELDEKIRYFTELRALNDDSGDEEDQNDAAEVLSRCRKGVVFSSPFSSPPTAPEQGTSKLSTSKKVPGLFRTTSAAVRGADIVKETPLILRKSGLRIVQNATPSEKPRTARISTLSSDVVSIKETPQTALRKNPLLSGVMTPRSEVSVVQETPRTDATDKQSSRPHERRTASSPVVGSASLKLPYKAYSTGIQEMLGKRKADPGKDTMPPKKKIRKGSTSEKKPPQHLAGMVFYYVPPDDKAKHRKIRISNAIKYGAVWTQEIAEATHVVAENNHLYTNVMRHLKLDSLPEGLILVNDRYTGDSIQYGRLVTHTQEIYAVKGYKEALAVLSATALEATKNSGKIKAIGTSSTGKSPPQNQLWNQINPSEAHERVLAESPPIQDTTTFVNIPQESPWYGDELDEMIKVAQRSKDMPLDEGDDDGDSRPSSRGNDPETSGSEEEHSSLRKGKRKRKGTGFAQENFQCMTGGTAVEPETNPNAYTIEVLQEMGDIYVRLKDQWRQTAYRKAIGTLKKQASLISTYDQAIELPCIGHRLAEKIVEIVATGRLRRLEFAKMEPSDQILQIFMKIYGVGISQASKWVQQGHKTLEDLKEKVHLTEHQRMGIDHYDDLQTRIPRGEVSALGEIVRGVAADIDSTVQMTIGGSYRRGALTSGDIDCLFTKADTTSSNDLLPFLYELIHRLTTLSFLVYAVATPSEHGSGSKWHGCCVLPGAEKQIWRRIDLLLVPETELGAALIYFTGDDIFNRSLRLLASKFNMRLNQRGLYREVMRGQDRVKVTEGVLIEGADEKKIFEALGVPWRAPEHRILH